MIFKAERKNNQPEEILQNAVDRGVEAAVGLVRKRFDRNPDLTKRLPYHSEKHTRSVVERTATILRTIQRAAPELVSDRDIEVGRLAAGFHDTVQEEDEPVLTPDGGRQRKRKVGLNEAASAEEAAAFMKDANAEVGEEIFAEKEFAMVREAIMGTVPTFDPGLGTVLQQKITSESSVIARAVALADIGVGGLDEKQVVDEGDRVFQEEKLDITSYIVRAYILKEDTVSPEAEEKYIGRMVAWAKVQVRFVSGRKERFDKEIEGFPEEVKRALRGLFSRFDASIEGLTKNVLKREQAKSFRELALTMGYRILKRSF